MSQHATIPHQTCSPDAEWDVIAAAQGGDRAAFGHLYAQHWRAVMGAVMNRVDKDWALAEDLTQDTFLDAWECIGRTEFRSHNIRSWLVSMACRRVNQHYWGVRHRGLREVPVPEWWGVAELPAPAGPVDPTATDLHDGTVEATTHLWLALLSPRQRECLKLRYLECRPRSEVAEVMGCTPVAVTTLERNAKRRLRALSSTDLECTRAEPHQHPRAARPEEAPARTTR